MPWYSDYFESECRCDQSRNSRCPRKRLSCNSLRCSRRSPDKMPDSTRNFSPGLSIISSRTSFRKSWCVKLAVGRRPPSSMRLYKVTLIDASLDTSASNHGLFSLNCKRILKRLCQAEMARRDYYTAMRSSIRFFEKMLVFGPDVCKNQRIQDLGGSP